MSLVAFCEGKKTEPGYLSEFAFEWGNKLVNLRLVRGAGVPLTLVEAAVDEKRSLERQARRSGNSFDANFEVWAIFDCDEHPNLPKAKALARKNGVKMAISNPCFELWALLHFQNQDAEIHRHVAQRELAKHMPSYDRNGGKALDYKQMSPLYPRACKRAAEIWRRRIEEHAHGGNPSTSVPNLLDVIVKNGSTRLQKAARG